MSAPQVSVVIPTRNRWGMLEHAISSALGQEDVRVEVVVVDDGSTDETPDALSGLVDARLRVLRYETSQGVAQARNRGIAEATGEWVAFLDDDDIWSPRKLRAQIDAAEGAQAGFAYTGAVLLDTEWRAIELEPAPDPEDLATKLLTHNAIPAGASNVLVHAALLDRVGGFDERLFQLADWDLWIRLVATAGAAAVPELLVGYLKHSQNMLIERQRDLFEELRYIATKHPEPGRGWRIAGISLSRWIGASHLRAGRRREAAGAYMRGARAYRSPRSALLAARALIDPLAVRTRRRADGAVSSQRPEWVERLIARRDAAR